MGIGDSRSCSPTEVTIARSSLLAAKEAGEPASVMHAVKHELRGKALGASSMPGNKEALLSVQGSRMNNLAHEPGLEAMEEGTSLGGGGKASHLHARGPKFSLSREGQKNLSKGCVKRVN